MLSKRINKYVLLRYLLFFINIPLILSLMAIFTPVASQTISVDFSQEFILSTNIIQFFVLLTVLSIAPGIIMMVTCFPFMVTVLSVLRQALGVPQTPPNIMIVSLAMFLTFYVMQPIFEKSWKEGITPYINGISNEEVALKKTITPLKEFMERRTSLETSSFLQNLVPATQIHNKKNASLDFSILIPAYMITEIERAFKIGFLIFIPFVIIDLVISALLMSMGMMMLPPASISLPIKLAFFTLSNGWSLLATALVKSYTG